MTIIENTYLAKKLEHALALNRENDNPSRRIENERYSALLIQTPNGDLVELRKNKPEVANTLEIRSVRLTEGARGFIIARDYLRQATFIASVNAISTTFIFNFDHPAPEGTIL